MERVNCHITFLKRERDSFSLLEGEVSEVASSVLVINFNRYLVSSLTVNVQSALDVLLNKDFGVLKLRCMSSAMFVQSTCQLLALVKFLH